MNSICFLAQFPPPMHGLSKAVETLFNSRLKEKYHFSRIDITNNNRFLQSLLALMRCKSNVVYFTPSQTRGENLRDLVFLKLIRWRGKKCIVHIHGGYYRQLVDNDIPGWQRRMNYHAVERLAGGIVLGHSLHRIFEPAEETYFKKHTEGLRNVVFHGVVGGQDKVYLLNQCHIFSLLSRSPNEGQPISILEAMGNGMAVIATDHAGIPEIASHDNGFACSKKGIDVNEIYSYLLNCYDNREQLAKVCELNYREVKAKYTEKQYIDNMDKIFSTL